MKDVKLSKTTKDGKVWYVLQTEKEEVMKYSHLEIIVGRAAKEGYNITNLQEFLKQEKGEA